MKRQPERRTSVRRRLLARIALPVALLLVAGTVWDLFSSARPIREAYDQTLSDAALALALNVHVDRDGHINANVPKEALSLLRGDTSDSVYFQVGTPDGSVLAGDRDLPRVTSRGQRNPAHQTSQYQGQRVRLATYRLQTQAGDVLITVAETLNKRGRIRAKLLTRELGADLLQMLAFLACVWFGVRGALRPLDRLGEMLGNRSPGDLTPLPKTGVPQELRNVVDKLNSLLATIDESGRAERQFIESAAHQLRTPLSGIMAQLELLVADEKSPDKQARIAFVLEASRRLSRTTHQLLALARSEHRAYNYAESRPVDLAALATSCVSAHVARASAAGIDLGAELGAANIEGVHWLLEEALNNLLDNAITYTPVGGVITVRTGVRAEGPFIEVVDSGTGIPESERESVVVRFYRGAQARGGGSGLGLAIVADVATRHAARMSIGPGDDGVGTCVRLVFPSRPSPSLAV